MVKRKVEMAQLVNFLHYMLKNPSTTPETHVKDAGLMKCICHPSALLMERGRPLGLSSQPT